MKTIDEPMPICEAEMERLEDQLVEDCKSLGMAESIRDFLQEPFSEWMDELADEYAGQVDIYKVNVDEEEELAALFGIRSVPSLLFVPMNGTPQMAQGALPKKNLKEAIQNVLLKND